MQKIRCHWLQLLAIWSYYATINARFRRLEFFNCCCSRLPNVKFTPTPYLCCCYHLPACLSGGVLEGGGKSESASPAESADKRTRIPPRNTLKVSSCLFASSRRKSCHHFCICLETRVSWGGVVSRKMLKSLSRQSSFRWKEVDWQEVEITIVTRECKQWENKRTFRRKLENNTKCCSPCGENCPAEWHDDWREEDKFAHSRPSLRISPSTTQLFRLVLLCCILFCNRHVLCTLLYCTWSAVCAHYKWQPHQTAIQFNIIDRSIFPGQWHWQ